MAGTPNEVRGRSSFRRALGYLLPHRRTLFMGLLAALGVGLFYTFSISSVVPLLKVIFAEHETLADWLHRAEAEHRLGAVIPADLPDDPRGIDLVHVRPQSPNARTLRAGDRLTALDGQPGGSFALMPRLALHDPASIVATVAHDDGTTQDTTLTLTPGRWWWRPVNRFVGWLPAGRSANDRLLALAFVMVALVAVSLLGGVCRFFNEGLVNTAVQRAMHDIRSGLAGHVIRLPLDWHSSQPPGDTLARFATDLSKVEVGMTTLFGKVIREPLKAIGVLALTLAIDWRLLVVALIGLPIGGLVLRTFGRLVKRAQQRASASWGRLLDHLGERLHGIRVVKASNMEEAESRRFEHEGRELTRAQTHIELVDAATNPALEILAMVAVAAFVVYGGSRVFHQELEPHLFFAAVVCLGGIFDPVRKMGNVNNRLQAAEASAQRLFDLLDLPAEEPAAASAPPLGPPHREIRFERVSFAYPARPNQPVLCDVDFCVTPGQVVALVGPNGSGKTTLISLLLRFYAPTAGRILFDERDIAAAPLDSLRAQIGLVTQEAIIFSDTIRGNIAYGANGVADEQVLRAAQLAHVDEFVRDLRVERDGQATTGYQAQISGRTLSGGQRQRLALARAILRDPPILILDEATSQVDSESERRIQEALDDVTRDRTTFIIAHRFSTIHRADMIVVLDAGRVVGIGRHAELLASCPLYVTLCQTQFAQPASTPEGGAVR